MTKMKVSLFGAVLVFGGGALLLQLSSTNGRLRAEIEELRAQQQNAAQTVAPGANSPTSVARKTDEDRSTEAELLRLRGEIGRMNLELQTLRVVGFGLAGRHRGLEEIG